VARKNHHHLAVVPPNGAGTQAVVVEIAAEIARNVKIFLALKVHLMIASASPVQLVGLLHAILIVQHAVHVVMMIVRLVVRVVMTVGQRANHVAMMTVRNVATAVVMMIVRLVVLAAMMTVRNVVTAVVMMTVRLVDRVVMTVGQRANHAAMMTNRCRLPVNVHLKFENVPVVAAQVAR
jgi:hypothetical protein